MTNEKHTKTPWYAKTRHGITWIDDGQLDASLCICEMAETFDEMIEQPQANAAFIVRAVNAHEALVEALNNADAQIVSILNEPRFSLEYRNSIASTLEQARAALKLAKGED